MDKQVLAALRKWPNVPHCYGWLALDVRGNWYMRDERIQARGPFPAVKGSRIEHDKLLAFIHRNYACDAQGAWFFQNGPQRVYVQLEAAPWVWRVQAHPAQSAKSAVAADAKNVTHAVSPSCSLASHTGQAAGAVQSTWLDDAGRLFAQCPLGFGLVHSLDMGEAADALVTGAWPAPTELAFAAMPAQFGFVLEPAPLQTSS